MHRAPLIRNLIGQVNKLLLNFMKFYFVDLNYLHSTILNLKELLQSEETQLEARWDVACVRVSLRVWEPSDCCCRNLVLSLKNWIFSNGDKDIGRTHELHRRGSRILVRGPSTVLPSKGGVPRAQKLLKIGVFPLQLPENYMILKKSWGQGGPGQLDPLLDLLFFYPGFRRRWIEFLADWG